MDETMVPANDTVALPPQAPPPPPAPDSEAVLRLAEAYVLAATEPVTARALSQVLPDGVAVEAAIDALRARYAGRGVELVTVGGGITFHTAPDLAEALRRVVQVPRRLPRAAMETLAIIAWYQPVTRAEIEEKRGVSLAQTTLEALLEQGLIETRGTREAPGRPTLWGTGPGFLVQFGLTSLKDLPRKEDLLIDPAVSSGLG